MSTKPIREALEKMKFRGEPSCMCHEWEDRDAYAAALEAVRAIEEMARSIVEDGSHDYIHGHGLRTEAALLEAIAKEAP